MKVRERVGDMGLSVGEGRCPPRALSECSFSLSMYGKISQYQIHSPKNRMLSKQSVIDFVM